MPIHHLCVAAEACPARFPRSVDRRNEAAPAPQCASARPNVPQRALPLKNDQNEAKSKLCLLSPFPISIYSSPTRHILSPSSSSRSPSRLSAFAVSSAFWTKRSHALPNIPTPVFPRRKSEGTKPPPPAHKPPKPSSILHLPFSIPLATLASWRSWRAVPPVTSENKPISKPPTPFPLQKPISALKKARPIHKIKPIVTPRFVNPGKLAGHSNCSYHFQVINRSFVASGNEHNW